MKNVIFLVFSIIILGSCSTINESEHQGYIMFLHAGEQDMPVSPFLIICKGDTTHLKYKTMEDIYPFSYFINMAGYHPSNIDTVSYAVFNKMKDILLDYPLTSDTLPNGKSGSLNLLIGDSIKTIRLTMPSGNPTAFYLQKLADLSKIEGQTKSERRLMRYKNMQRK